jgi:hypothetical protein
VVVNALMKAAAKVDVQVEVIFVHLNKILKTSHLVEFSQKIKIGPHFMMQIRLS